MIDFRYHLISLIAVLLALALGILVGSGFIGDPLLADIERRAEQVQSENAELLDRADELDREVDRAMDLQHEVEPLLTDGVLSGSAIVLFAFSATDGGTVQEIEDRLTSSGATVASRITFTDGWELDSVADRELLALILRSTLSTAGELLPLAGQAIGDRVATVAAVRADRPPGGAETRLAALMEELEEAGFVSLRAADPDTLVPRGALFVVVGGGASELRWDVVSLTAALAAETAEAGHAIVVGEPADSRWGLVAALRDLGDVAGAVTTVDNADSPAGRMALVLGLEMMVRGVVGHYGTGPGAGSLLPDAGT